MLTDIMAFVAGLPAFLADRPYLILFAFLFGAVGVAVWASGVLRRPGTAPEWGGVDAWLTDDAARAVRIAADDVERAAWMHAPAWAIEADRPPVLDDRTAHMLTVDPTLRPADVAAIVEQVAPGAGSVASVAAAVIDTRLRTSEMVTELTAAEEAAYAEEAERAERRFFAVFNLHMDQAVQRFQHGTGRADMWLCYLHDGRTECTACATALAHVSDEFRQIVGRVEREDTQEIDVRELRRELATTH